MPFSLGFRAPAQKPGYTIRFADFEAARPESFDNGTFCIFLLSDEDVFAMVGTSGGEWGVRGLLGRCHAGFEGRTGLLFIGGHFLSSEAVNHLIRKTTSCRNRERRRLMRVRSSMSLLFVAGVLIGSLVLLGCPKRPEVMQAGPAAVGSPAAVAPPTTPAAPPVPKTGETPVTRPTPPSEVPVQPAKPAGPAAAAPMAASPLKDLFFDYDKSVIRDDQKGVLGENVSWLKGNASAKITVEGHCDERGTAEYNLGLGERRAKAVKDYLIAAGIAADRISTISYGKERPFVLGHDESAWKWNRRGHFVITGK
jgi:peptidoglycan-associated lipoprotein